MVWSKRRRMQGNTGRHADARACRRRAGTVPIQRVSRKIQMIKNYEPEIFE
jgi:hypothetical protein